MLLDFFFKPYSPLLTTLILPVPAHQIGKMRPVRFM
jgi:hypothetical protein